MSMKRGLGAWLHRHASVRPPVPTRRTYLRRCAHTRRQYRVDCTAKSNTGRRMPGTLRLWVLALDSDLGGSDGGVCGGRVVLALVAPCPKQMTRIHMHK
eukprot:3922388-Rhodomonas_salina.1